MIFCLLPITYPSCHWKNYSKPCVKFFCPRLKNFAQKIISACLYLLQSDPSNCRSYSLRSSTFHSLHSAIFSYGNLSVHHLVRIQTSLDHLSFDISSWTFITKPKFFGDFCFCAKLIRWWMVAFPIEVRTGMRISVQIQVVLVQM